MIASASGSTPGGSTSDVPLAHLVVIEVTSPDTAAAGELLADAGADVILVDPADLGTGSGRQLFRHLVERADVLVEAEPPGRLADLGIDYTDLTRRLTTGGIDPTPGPPPINDRLIHASLTPLGRTDQGIMSDQSRSAPLTELTIQARGGHLSAADSNGWPTPSRPVAPTAVAAHVAVLAIMTALITRPEHGSQFVDVSILAAANLSAGPETVVWLAGGGGSADDDDPGG